MGVGILAAVRGRTGVAEMSVILGAGEWRGTAARF